MLQLLRHAPSSHDALTIGVDAFTRLVKPSSVAAIISMKAVDAFRTITQVWQQRGSKTLGRPCWPHGDAIVQQ